MKSNSLVMSLAVIVVVVVGVTHLLGALDRLEPSLKNREKDLQFLRTLLHSSDFNVLMKVRRRRRRSSCAHVTLAPPLTGTQEADQCSGRQVIPA